MPGLQPWAQHPGQQSAQQAPKPHDRLGQAQIGVAHVQHLGHNGGDAPNHHRRQNQVEGGQHQGHSQKDRLFPGDIPPALPQVLAHRGQHPGGPGAPLVGDADENFHHRRGEEADPADGENGSQSPQAEDDAPQGGPQQVGQGGYHVDHRVALGEPVWREQQGQAGLDRRLVGPGDGVKEHQRADHQGHQRGLAPQQAETYCQSGGEKVQPHHDAALVDPVRRRAADGTHEDHGQEGTGVHHPEQGDGARLPQQIQGQGEVKDGVSKEGDDLPNDHQGKIPGEQGAFLCFHSDTPFIIEPTVGLYIGQIKLPKGRFTPKAPLERGCQPQAD